MNVLQKLNLFEEKIQLTNLFLFKNSNKYSHQINSWATANQQPTLENTNAVIGNPTANVLVVLFVIVPSPSSNVVITADVAVL